MNVELVVATDENGLIGADNKLPWHCPRDLARFREITSGHTVLMGRKTWESLPSKFRPLPNRKNVVITTNPNYAAQGAHIITSLDELIDLDEPIMVIGGETIYRLLYDCASVIHLTLIHGTYEGDAYFNIPKDDWLLEVVETHDECTFYRLTRNQK